MCGIAGYISKVNHERFILNSGLIQSHRGPDDSKSIFKNINNYRIGLGHQRLSILDLTTSGSQPMTSKSENYHIIFNGEIYNHNSLKKEFSILSLRGSSDTELALELIEKLGIENACKKFIGMWAIAVIDIKNNKVFFSRDRIGKKPLYYFLDKDSIFFSSEIKSLINLNQVNRELNYNSIEDYLSNSIISRSDQTFFKHIQSFPKSHIGMIDLNSDHINLKLSKYWDIYEDKHKNFHSNNLNDLIKDSVNIRIEADVPVGIALSGGLDSSVIASCVKNNKKIKNGNLSFFSFVSPGHYSNEEKYIDQVSKYLNIPVNKVYAENDDADAMINNIISCNLYNDAPIFSFSSVFFRNMMKKAKNNGVKVMLTGQGADEVFCGYRKYPFKYTIKLFQELKIFKSLYFILPFLLNNLLHQGYSYAEAKRYLGVDNSKILSKFYKIIKTNNKYKTYKRDIRDQQIRDILETSVPALCHYEDRMGMAESIEVHSPFLDHRIIEYGLNISEENKMRFGWSKYILRKTFKNELPKSIIWRKDKKGFSNPEDYWLKEKLKSFVLDVALS